MPLSPPGSSIVRSPIWIVPPGSALIRNGFSPQTPSHLQYWIGIGLIEAPAALERVDLLLRDACGFCAKRASGAAGRDEQDEVA